MEDDAADPGAFDSWTADFAAQLLPFTMRAHAGEDVPFTMHAARAADVRIARIEVGAHEAWRGSRLTTVADKAIVVCHQVEGVSTVSQAGRDAELRPGDFTFYRASAPVAVRFHVAGVGILAIIPERRLSFDSAWLADTVARRVDGTDPVARGFAGYLTAIDEIDDRDPRRRAIALEGAIALFETMQRCAFDVPGADDPRGAVRRAIYDRAIEVIGARAADRRLTVAAVADECFVSSRQLQSVLADYGRTFRELTSGARIAAAAAMLRAERHRSTPLVVVARECGFATASHFAQRFRERTGVSPSVYRSELLRRAAPAPEG